MKKVSPVARDPEYKNQIKVFSAWCNSQKIQIQNINQQQTTQSLLLTIETIKKNSKINVQKERSNKFQSDHLQSVPTTTNSTPSDANTFNKTPQKSLNLAESCETNTSYDN